MALKFPDIFEHNNSDLPIVDSSNLLGGHFSVADTAARDAIPIGKRRVRMLVSYNSGAVEETKKFLGSTVADVDWENESNWLNIPGGITYNSTAAGLPSTTGAGDVDFARVNDYYSETAITNDVLWGLTNIVVDKVRSVDVKVSTFSVTLVEAGVTFKGSVDSGGIVQGLDNTKSNLIMIWAETATIMWVKAINNEA